MCLGIAARREARLSPNITLCKTKILIARIKRANFRLAGDISRLASHRRNASTRKSHHAKSNTRASHLTRLTVRNLYTSINLPVPNPTISSFNRKIIFVQRRAAFNAWDSCAHGLTCSVVFLNFIKSKK